MEKDRLDDLQDRVTWLEKEVMSALRGGVFLFSMYFAFEINKQFFPEKTWDFVAWGSLILVWIGAFLLFRWLVFQGVPKRIRKLGWPHT